MASIWDILFGKSEKMQNVSTLNPQQQQAHNQYMQAISGQGAGGAFGDAADYYRSLLGGDSETEQQMAAPMMRQFQQDIIPGLSEQFAGMGSGGLSSSSFRNAGVQAGTDLSERLAALRAGLRQQGAQGLYQMGQGAFNPVQENIFRPQTYGLAGEFASGAGKGVGMGLGYGAKSMFGV